MNVQGYQKMSLLDYPGKVACTVFTGGCNLRCPFCHNAGLVKHPTEGVSREAEVLLYLEERRSLLDAVCITGGEPLLQPDLKAFLQRIKEMGYAVKLDTNGSLPARLEEVLATGFVDYVAMDVKSSFAGYAAATGEEGIDTAPFERSIRLLQNSGVPHEFRTTLVKGIHTKEDIEAIARMLTGERRYFLQKFVDSGNLIGSGCTAFSEEETADILAGVRTYIPTAEIRG